MVVLNVLVKMEVCAVKVLHDNVLETEALPFTVSPGVVMVPRLQVLFTVNVPVILALLLT